MIGDSLSSSERAALGKISKYSGAKDELFPVLIRAIGKTSGSYYEPFMGSGSVFYRLAQVSMLRSRAVLSDANPDVINLHRTLRDHVEELIQELEREQRVYNALPSMAEKESFYYRLRDEFNGIPQPRSGTHAAAIFMGLLRLGFNGIIRYGPAGNFNISWNKREAVDFFPRTTPVATFRADSKLLREPGVSIFTSDFEATARNARPGDTVYTDPPYYNSSSAKQYTVKGFTQQDQLRLKALADQLSTREVRFIEDNSQDPFILDLYCRPPSTYICASVTATEKVAQDPLLRGVRNEVIVSNRVRDGGWAVPAQQALA